MALDWRTVPLSQTTTARPSADSAMAAAVPLALTVTGVVQV
jgi:hypothetical protein